MTILHVNHSVTTQDSATATSSVTTGTFTSTTGNFLVAGGVQDGTSTEGATPWSDGGTNTWTGNKSPNNTDSGTQFANIGYAKNITGKASQSVTYTLGASTFPADALIEFSGVDTSAPEDVAPSWNKQLVNTGSHAFTTNLITPSAGERLLIALFAVDANGLSQSVANASGATGTATWTLYKLDAANTESLAFAWAVVAADGSKTYGCTLTPDATLALYTITGGISAYKATSGGGSTAPIGQLFFARQAAMRAASW